MSKENPLGKVSAEALVPEQLLHYVNIISESKSKLFGPCLVHIQEDTAIVVGYPLDGKPEAFVAADLAKCLDEVRKIKDLERIKVLAPFRPKSAPEWAKYNSSEYWHIPLPYAAPKPRGFEKMLAAKPFSKLPVLKESWGQDYEALVEHFSRGRNLTVGAQRTFQTLKIYLANNAEAKLFGLRSPDGRLLACLIADYTSKHTAFYMTSIAEAEAKREDEDALLRAAIEEAENQGKRRINLGLGINPAMPYFKKTFGARPFMPIVETVWEVGDSGVAQAKWYASEMARRKAEQANEHWLLKLKRWIGL